MKKRITMVCLFVLLIFVLCSCDAPVASGTSRDVAQTQSNANGLAERQPTPADIQYSLERYNLIRRTYWVNGMRERADTLPCEVEKPMGYVILFSGNTVVCQLCVDGKVSSLNSFLTPDSEYYEIATGNSATYRNRWLADVDGSYGSNDSGIFFFTPEGRYIEWSGDYLYSDIPFEIGTPVVHYEVEQ